MLQPKKPKRDKWEIEEDVRTLLRAEEIKASTVRFAQAKKMADTQIKNLNKVKTKTKSGAKKK